MVCELCVALNEDWRMIAKSDYSFCIIVKWPLKAGHLMVLPKRHVCELSKLTPDEAEDILTLCEKMKFLLKEKYDEDPLILLNSGKHSSEEHLHFHVWPSKGGLRDLVSSLEGCPKRQEISREQYDLMKKELMFKYSELQQNL